jgi:hypothetical protein
LTIFELVSSLIGTGITGYLLSNYQLLLEKSKFLYSLPFINISYFGSSSVILTILLIIKQLKKIEQLFFYKFSNICSFIYSILSKCLALFNLFSFFYLLCFISEITFTINDKELPIYEDVITDIKYKCINETVDCGIPNAKDELDNIDYIDFALFCFSVFFFIFNLL